MSIFYISFLYQILCNILGFSLEVSCLRNSNVKTANRPAWMCRLKWLFIGFQVLHRPCCMSWALILHNSVALTVSVSQRWCNKIMQLPYFLVLTVVLSGKLGRFSDAQLSWCCKFKGKKHWSSKFQIKMFL